MADSSAGAAALDSAAAEVSVVPLSPLLQAVRASAPTVATVARRTQGLRAIPRIFPPMDVLF